MPTLFVPVGAPTAPHSRMLIVRIGSVGQRTQAESVAPRIVGSVAAKDDLPWQGLKNPFDILSSQVQALPYHIYTLAARIPSSDYTQRAQYGSVFVFLLLVALLSVGSMVLRSKLRAKLKW